MIMYCKKLKNNVKTNLYIITIILKIIKIILKFRSILMTNFMLRFYFEVKK